jgi:hypothetical protein
MRRLVCLAHLVAGAAPPVFAKAGRYRSAQHQRGPPRHRPSEAARFVLHMSGLQAVTHSRAGHGRATKGPEVA